MSVRVEGKSVLLFLLIVVFVINSSNEIYASSISSVNQTACYPGCFIEITLSSTENVSNITTTYNDSSIISQYIFVNESYVMFYNNTHNFTENQDFKFRIEIDNSGNNKSISFTIMNNSVVIFLNTDYNFDYYEEKISYLDKKITKFDILQGENSVLSSFYPNIGLVDVVITANVEEYASNKTYSTTFTLKNVNATKIDFTKYIYVSDSNTTIYNIAKEFESLPKFILSLKNYEDFISNYLPSLYTITISTDGQTLDAWHYTALNLVKIINIVGEDKKIIGTDSYLTLKLDLIKPIAVNDYDVKPVIISVEPSDNTIHTGQTVSFKVLINDTDLKYVSINGVPLTSISRIQWVGNISITSSPATLYVIDKMGNSILMENITFEINDLAPILRLYEPTEKYYLDGYVDVIWSSEDEALNETYMYIDNGKYSKTAGYILTDGTYKYNLTSSGTLRLNNLAPGLHKLELISVDNFSNERKKEVFFKMNIPANTTKFTKEVLGFDYFDYLKFLNQTYPVFNNETNQTINVSCNYTYNNYRQNKGINRILEWNFSNLGNTVDLDNDISTYIKLNETKYETGKTSIYDIQLSFKGIDANFDKFFGINKSTNIQFEDFINTINVSIIDMFFFDRIHSFFLKPELYNMSVTFHYPFNDYIVMYYEDEKSLFPKRLSNDKIIIRESDFTLSLNGIYGIIILKNDADTKIVLNNFESTFFDNNVNISGNVYSSSNSLLCTYEIKNFIVLKPFKKTGTIDINTNVDHPFNIYLENTPNDYYKLNITCKDIEKNERIEYLNYFNLNDLTPPKVTSIRNVGPDMIAPYSFENRIAITLETPKMTIFTNEISTCGYSEEDVLFEEMTEFEETGSTKHTMILLLNKYNYTLFVRCTHEKKNDMLEPLIVRYIIKDKYVPPSSSIPSVGEGTNFNPIEGTGDDIIFWQKVDKDSFLNINIIEENISSFESIKLTIGNDLNNISMTLTISDENNKYNITSVYSSMTMKTYNFGNNDLYSRIIFFRVSNEWMEKNKIKSENIAIKELNDKDNLLIANTYKLRTSSDYTYYRAETEYFNTYFITTYVPEETSLSIKEADYNNANEKNKESLIKKDTKPIIEQQKINITQRSYTVVTSLIVIFSLIVAIMIISRQMNAKQKEELQNLYKTRNKLEEIKIDIEDKKQEDTSKKM
ncbi:MAG: PGF-pre-PGF domain-containing protein [Candidatus Woesearchaeota archaeon]|jgi:PGF-pre-PGF domain-containing protein